MSWLSDRWGNGPSIKGLESSVKGTAHTVGDVASSPIAQAIAAGLLTATGVGAPAAAAILAGSGALGGALKPGGNAGSALGGAASGALAGGAGALAGKALGGLGSAASNIPGVQGIEQALGGAGSTLSKIPGAQAVEQGLGGVAKNALGSLTGGAGGAADSGGGLGGLLGGLGGWITGNGGKNALGAAEGVNAALLQKQANDYAGQALNQAQALWNQRAPLRTGGMAAMQASLGRNPFAGAAPVAQAVPTPPVGA